MSLLEKVKSQYPSRSMSTMRSAMIDLESRGQKFARSPTVIQGALHEQGYEKLADKIANCKPSRPCSNPYCDKCQKQIFVRQRKRFQDNLSAPYQHDDNSIRENVFFVTVLHELVPFDMPETDIIRFPMDKVRSAMEKARKQFKAVRRSFDDQPKFIGAFELEAVNGLLVSLKPVKGQVLADMAGRQVDLSDRFVLVHSHFMVDLADLPVADFKARLKKVWSQKRQVDISALYRNKPVAESLNRLADYPFKFPIKYYLEFADIGVDQRVKIEGRKHNVNRRHDPAVIAEMVKATAEIGTNKLTIRLGTSRGK